MVESTANLQTKKTTEPTQIFSSRKFVRNLITRRSWFLAFIVFDMLIIYAILNSEVLTKAWEFIVGDFSNGKGLGITLQITVVAFFIALIVGLITALGRISKNPIIYNVATFYVEVFRGLPLLVIILIFAFVVTPAVVDLIAGGPLDNLFQQLLGADQEKVLETNLRTRDIEPIWRIMFAFALTYAAFMSEVFRAGIESIGHGQMEAARSLGMTYFQAMRTVILPQAIRNVLPALANNFVFLLKDTSLASVVAVPEISHLTRQYSSNRFRYPEGLLILSFVYANLTVILSMGVYWLEARLQGDRRED